MNTWWPECTLATAGDILWPAVRLRRTKKLWRGGEGIADGFAGQNIYSGERWRQ
ncbi:MAG: hypothetical protein L0228_18225 [Planctomycetes bacterium]|nr:hypothetical protein [Planctomycetota bacterium]